MAAPVPTARGTPAGTRIDDGFRTLITFALNPTINFWEKEVMPPGYDGGDPVSTSTMHNLTFRTMNPRKLVTMSECTVLVAYDPFLFSQSGNNLFGLLNRKTTVTVTFPDGTTLAFFGYLQKAKPNACKEGDQPDMEITIIVTNQDPVSGVETGPTLTNVPGT